MISARKASFENDCRDLQISEGIHSEESDVSYNKFRKQTFRQRSEHETEERLSHLHHRTILRASISGPRPADAAAAALQGLREALEAAAVQDRVLGPRTGRDIPVR